MTQDESWFSRLRKRRPGLDHLIKAYDAFTERYGNHFAASITYFSVLSLFPLLLIGFAVLGFVLAGQPDVLTDMRTAITDSAPAGLHDLLTQLLDGVVQERGKVGVIGLLAALYTGFGWMSNLRDALTAQWGQKPVQQPILRWIAVDLLALLGLGLAMVVSFGLSAVGAGAADWLLGDIGGWGRFLVIAITTLLSVGANWLVFLWVITRLPRTSVRLRSAARGALAGAIGFEVLKTVATIYLNAVISGPIGAIVGPIVGLLVFANLVSRFLLFITAWTATAEGNEIPVVVQPPSPAVIRPTIEVSRAPKVTEAVGLVGAGALLGLVLRKKL